MLRNIIRQTLKQQSRRQVSLLNTRVIPSLINKTWNVNQPMSARQSLFTSSVQYQQQTYTIT